MSFQEQAEKIVWKIHFSSPIEKVFEYLTTDQGRSKFWAEETKEENGTIEFSILNYPKYTSTILEQIPSKKFRLDYFGTDVTFDLEPVGNNETDLKMTALVNNEVLRQEMTAGWVSVLMAMKGAVDFGIDLRNHHPKRVWEHGYVDN